MYLDAGVYVGGEEVPRLLDAREECVSSLPSTVGRGKYEKLKPKGVPVASLVLCLPASPLWSLAFHTSLSFEATY